MLSLVTADALAPYRSDAPTATPGELMIAVATDWFFRIPALRLAEAPVLRRALAGGGIV